VKEQVMAGGSQALSAIPVLGSGLGYRRELRQAILESRSTVDFLEVVTEQFIGGGERLRELEEICAVFPVIPHGVGLSIGSVDVDADYLRAIKRVSDVAKSPYYSEHLAMTRAPGIDIGHLAPLWFTETVLRHTIDNVRHVQDYLQKPLVLENVTYQFVIPGAGMTQAEFFTRLVEATQCGVLLDVTNVYINSVNHQFDAVAFLKEMPLESVVQIHLAGGYVKDGMVIDAHSERVDEGSWQLLDVLTGMTVIKGSILEHDANFPEDMSAMLDQLDRARQAITRRPADVRLANPV
jgi:uncharacterized protein (UPF0276 family)